MQGEQHNAVILVVNKYAAAIHKFTFLCSFITDISSFAIMQAIENHYHITSDGNVSDLSLVCLFSESVGLN